MGYRLLRCGQRQVTTHAPGLPAGRYQRGRVAAVHEGQSRQIHDDPRTRTGHQFACLCRLLRFPAGADPRAGACSGTPTWNGARAKSSWAAQVQDRSPHGHSPRNPPGAASPPGSLRDVRPRCARLPGSQGGPLRRGNFNRSAAWPQAAAAIGAPGLHFHDRDTQKIYSRRPAARACGT
jgi:hypothetical protein